MSNPPRPRTPLLTPPGSIPATTLPGAKPRSVASPPPAVLVPRPVGAMGDPGKGPGFALHDHVHAGLGSSGSSELPIVIDNVFPEGYTVSGGGSWKQLNSGLWFLNCVCPASGIIAVEMESYFTVEAEVAGHQFDYRWGLTTSPTNTLAGTSESSIFFYVPSNSAPGDLLQPPSFRVRGSVQLQGGALVPGNTYTVYWVHYLGGTTTASDRANLSSGPPIGMMMMRQLAT